MFRVLLVVTATAAAQVLDVEPSLIQHVLNGRGSGAIRYAGNKVNADSVLKSYPECQSCSVNTPCAHRNLLNVGSCVAASSHEIGGKNENYCLDYDVCCGGTCRNSGRSPLQCSFLSSEVNGNVGKADFKSTLNLLEYVKNEATAFTGSRLDGLCNGWTLDGKLAPLSCATSCGCQSITPAAIVAGSTIECEKKIENGDSFFASGDKTLTADKKYGSIQGKSVCPEGFICTKSDTCVSFNTYKSFPIQTTSSGSTTSPESKSSTSESSSSNTVGIAVGSVVGVVVLAAAAFFIIRRKKTQESHGDYQALSDATL